MAFEAFFLNAGSESQGHRLCVFHPPQGTCRGAVVYLAPLAEEMNKSRRMVALQSQALAESGFGVLLIDLGGCGDSGGSLASASWHGWIDDACQAATWLRTRLPNVPLWMWGLRAGCLLASAAASAMPTPAHLLLWQPPISGKLVLHQFLRLRVGAQLLDGTHKGVVQQLRTDLAAGRSVVVSGYELPPAVADGLDLAQLLPLATSQRVCWLETSPREHPELLPASLELIRRWAPERALQSRAVRGPAFWQTTEIEEAPALIEATTQSLSVEL